MADYSYGVKERTNEYVWRSMIEYHETMRELWPVKLRLLKADRNQDVIASQEIRKEIQPIIDRAKKPLSNALLWRIRAKEAYTQREDVRKNENDRCRKDFIRFINSWCFTSDPRIVSFGLPSMLPFVLWPKQEEFLMFVNDCYSIGGMWLTGKSRAVGVTWSLAAWYVWNWIFNEGFIGGFGSRDKDAVDKLGDPDTIFAKVRFIIYNLPAPMLPKSYQGKSVAEQSQHDNYLRIFNPENDSTIRGEGGENIGAGGRSSIFIIDESALVQHPEKIDDSLSLTTNCRGDVSTVRGLNNFGEKLQEGKIRKFLLWFYQDPSKYERWRDNKMPSREQCPYLDYEYEEKGELVVAQELLMDLNRSVEDSFIPADWVQAAIDFDLPAVGERQSGFDVAGGGANKSVYTLRVGPVVFEPREYNHDTMQENLEEALNQAEEDKSELFAYDADGIGEPVWGHIKYSERSLKFNLYGIHGNSHASERYLFPDNMQARDKFRNKRAENYWNLCERFRKTYEHRKKIRMYDLSELISIPNNKKLVTQLSQPKKILGNKIGVEGKKEMKARNVKSPDYADSLVNSFADAERDAIVISDFNYKGDSENIGDFYVDPESPVGQQYVALVSLDNLMTCAIGCWWLGDFTSPVLRVFCEFVEKSSDIKKLVTDIKTVMNESIKPIREWVCNEEMLKSLEDSRSSPWYLYRQEKVSLRCNYNHDYNTSILTVNMMFAKKMIQVHTRCERLLMQLANWRMEGGKPQEGLGLAMALCQLVTRLRVKREITAVHAQPEWAPKHPYRGAQGHFSKVSKEEQLPRPAYMKLAEKQVKQGVGVVV